MDVIEGTYTDIPLFKEASTSQIYDDISGGTKEKTAYLRKLAMTDPSLAKKLIAIHTKSDNLTEKENLIRTLSPQRRADRLIEMGAHKNRALMREMMLKNIANPEVRRIIQLRTK